MAAVVALIDDLKAAKAAGRKDADLLAARYLQRRSQFYLDFVEAENSTGFHAPQEAARILGESIDFARQGQIALRDRPSSRPCPWSTFPHLRRRSPEGDGRKSTKNETRGQPGLLKRAWHRLRSPSARWSVLALVALGFVIGAIAIIGTAGDGACHGHR
jgi:hypothetical protein